MSIFRKVTLKTLLVNKTRTIVTIIGIILSLSMFTAVTVSVSSFQDYLLKITMHREGSWHAAVSITATDMESISSDKSVDSVTFLRSIGYARAEDSTNPDKPYLYIGGMDQTAEDILPINITDGHMPENDDELLIPEHLSYNGGVKYDLGETITLEIGDRISTDENGAPYILGQDTSYLYTKEELEKQGFSKTEINNHDTEVLSPRFTRTYTVVGFYERPATEPFSAPGYTVLTADSTAYTEADSYTAYICFHNPKDTIPWVEAHYPGIGSQINYSLLRMYGASFESSYNSVLYGMATILICIILFGSISLIYNAFSISVTERTQQFGLLSSLGATRHQLIHSVLFEAFSLCIIGIPLGILAGIAGIGVTFALLGSSMSNLLFGGQGVAFALHVSPSAVICAALIGLLTVLISAYLPARRSAKLSPIEAIRQTTDIVIRARGVKTSRLTYRVFGLSGMLASKNFKRNRKKYRATVISLFVSVVLFISASSFCSYLMTGATGVMSDAGCDITYRRFMDTAADITISADTLEDEEHPDAENPAAEDFDIEGSDEIKALSNDDLLKILSSLDGITDAAWAQNISSTVYIDKSALSQEYLDLIADIPREQDSQNPAVQDKIRIEAALYFIDDEAYLAYLEKSGLSAGQFTDADHPVAAVSDFLRFYSSDTGKYSTMHLLSSGKSSVTLMQLDIPAGYYSSGYYNDEQGNLIYYFSNKTTDEEIKVPELDCTIPVQLAIASVTDEVPFFLGDRYGETMILMYPASAMEAVLGQTQSADVRAKASVFYFTAKDPRSATAAITKTLQDLGLESRSVLNLAEAGVQERTMLMIITVFSYGFIILISLIAMANVFNTISTNIQLRKREFAMLRSTGMTPGGFRVMMCYECLLYGIKGLLYGLPVALAVTFWIYRSISSGWVVRFYIPWYSLVIAIGSVFLVVGSTMIYSMRKIGKENIMDNLKSETT